MIITGLLVGIVLGFVFQRGRFCVTGAFRDIFIAGSTRWFSAFILLIAVHAIGLLVLSTLGVIAPETSPFPWAASIVGGFVFGFAIILAGGCATGTYYRSGEGLVGSWFALVFYALFSAIMKGGPASGFTEWIRGITVADGTLPQTLGISAWVPAIVLTAVALVLLIHHQRRASTPLATLPPRRRGLAHLLAEKRWNPFATAAIIGVIATIAWPLSAASGRNAGLGVTTPSSNLVRYLSTGDTDLIDWGVMLIIGILTGSFIAAKASGEFRLRVPDAPTLLKSIAGGALMGVGAAIAGGCTVGNAMVETAQFSYQGWVSMACMMLGTGLAAKLTIRPATASGAATRVQTGTRATV